MLEELCVPLPSELPPKEAGRGGERGSESDSHKFFQVLGAELMCQNLPGFGDGVGFSITVDFGLDVYPFIFQTSSRLFILAILFQPGTSHTLPSGTLSGFIPTVLACSRNLSGNSDVAKSPQGWCPWFSALVLQGERGKWEELLERILKVLIPEFYSMDRPILSISVPW